MSKLDKEQSWFVYMVRCRDNSLYSGVTTDLTRREREHNTSVKGARYTRTRRPVTMVYNQIVANRSEAGKLEWQLKKLTKAKKELLVSGEAVCP